MVGATYNDFHYKDNISIYLFKSIFPRTVKSSFGQSITYIAISRGTQWFDIIQFTGLNLTISTPRVVGLLSLIETYLVFQLTTGRSQVM